MNKALLNINIQNFINKNLNKNPSELILKGVKFQGVSIQEIVEQIVSKKKCQKKLPTWFTGKSIYYPNKLNIEQTSSEITAKYKSELISGNTTLDLTGGFGVDCFAFAEKFNKITHCEINEELSKIVTHNAKQLNINNITFYLGNGLDLLNNNKRFDWVYADPSRRDKHKGKVFLLKDCLPNIPINLDLLFKHTDNILLKLSPILDISSTLKELNFVKTIHVIAINNEVKELLFILKKDFKNTIKIKTINIKNNEIEKFESSIDSLKLPTYSLVKKYLYEPNSAILKAGLFNEVSHQLNLDKIHNNSHLYTSNELIKFQGRRFEILHVTSYNKNKITHLIHTNKANITTRNFPETVAQIRKKTKIKDGGQTFMFFTTNLNNKLIVLICKKV
ncbi:MAG: class I SAM-dependent methyltransferase [Flavobacteriaceae bacterium]|nr:class I SAM-dependent methyltransferase [Flavobacteriaceae bacterium]